MERVFSGRGLLRLMRNALLPAMLACGAPVVVAQEYTFSSASASSSVWSPANAIDKSIGTQWSSVGRSSASATEWIAGQFAAPVTVNYVKIYPRMAGGVSYGFPEDFKVVGWNGSAWVQFGNMTYTGYPRPYRDDYIVLTVRNAATVSAIKVVATKLRPDSWGNYYFQIGEIVAGYDPLYAKLEYLGNKYGTTEFASSEVEIDNMGSGPFSPSKMGNWVFDKRNPIVEARPVGACGSVVRRNIYGANAVYEGPGTWKVFFGGWNGLCSNSPLDETWSARTTSTFNNKVDLSSHTLVMGAGDSKNAGNPSAVKASNGQWKLVYTALRARKDAAGNVIKESCLRQNLNVDGVNKPGLASSADGTTWNHTAANVNYMLRMDDTYVEPKLFNNEDCRWGSVGPQQAPAPSLLQSSTTGQDVNGTNVLFEEAGTWYLYWKGLNRSIQIAKSIDGGTNFVHQGKLLDGKVWDAQGEFSPTQFGVNDVKKINGQYVWAYHYNSQKLWYSFGTSALPSAMTNPSMGPFELFDSQIQPNYGNDKYIVSAGWVTDGVRLHGVLYGAGNSVGLDQNAIYARWLQKKARFDNGFTSLTWMKANGPDKNIVMMVAGSPLETGNVKVYDTDGLTLLHTSPRVTIREGDRWRFWP